MSNQDLKMVFGKIIRKKRMAKRISQESLAKRMGISCTYLREVEHGKYNMTWQNWLKICTALDVDIKTIQDDYIKPILSGEIQFS